LAVFALFHRFTTDFDLSVQFSAGAKKSSLEDLNILTVQRFVSIACLFHRPGTSSQHSPVTEIFERWKSIYSGFEKDLVRTVESWSFTKAIMTGRNAAALRAVLEISKSEEVFIGLGGVRGSVNSAFQLLVEWYSKLSLPNDRGHIVASFMLGLRLLVKDHLLQFVQLLKGPFPSIEKRWFIADLVKNDLGNELKERMKNSNPANVGEIDQIISVLATFPLASVISNVTGEDSEILLYEDEESGKEQDFENNDENESMSNVDRLKEIAPHLGRYFCKQLLLVFGGNLERAITSVMEGSLPEEVMHLDFSAETDPSENAPSKPLVRVEKDKSTADDVIRDGLENDLKTKLLSIYDRYEDEYDDTLDGGGRLVVDTGAKNLDEDEPSDEMESGSDEEEKPTSQSAPHFSKDFKPPFKGHTDLSMKRTDGPFKAQGSVEDSRKRAPHNGLKPLALERADPPHPKTLPKGRVAEESEEEKIRPDVKVTHASVSKHKDQDAEAGDEILPKSAEQIKRERARKEAKGNMVRQRGSDKKYSKGAF